MASLRPDMMDAPHEMRGRPVDHRGFYVPWFVTRKTAEGHWDFAGVDTNRLVECLEKGVCWVSGVPLGKFASFVVGPMCCINRVSAEPPVKRNIAEWSVKVCPFLSRPLAKRPGEAPEGHVTPGIMVADNPGLEFIWTCKRSEVYRGPEGLFRLGEPDSVTAWTKGRPAEKDEIRQVMEKGYEKLVGIARKHGQADTIPHIAEQDEKTLVLFESLGLV